MFISDAGEPEVTPSLSVRLEATKFVLPSALTLIETNCPQIWA